MSKKITEKKIENGLARYFSRNDCTVKTQVSFTQKRIDIVMKQQNLTSAVEVKIYDWKGALRQAFVNKMACDKSYVAIWHEFSHRALNNREQFENMGVGIIVINADYSPSFELEPSHNDFINPLAYNDIAQHV